MHPDPLLANRDLDRAVNDLDLDLTVSELVPGPIARPANDAFPDVWTFRVTDAAEADGRGTTCGTRRFFRRATAAACHVYLSRVGEI